MSRTKKIQPVAGKRYHISAMWPNCRLQTGDYRVLRADKSRRRFVVETHPNIEFYSSRYKFFPLPSMEGAIKSAVMSSKLAAKQTKIMPLPGKWYDITPVFSACVLKAGRYQVDAIYQDGELFSTVDSPASNFCVANYVFSGPLLQIMVATGGQVHCEGCKKEANKFDNKKEFGSTVASPAAYNASTERLLGLTKPKVGLWYGISPKHDTVKVCILKSGEYKIARVFNDGKAFSVVGKEGDTCLVDNYAFTGPHTQCFKESVMVTNVDGETVEKGSAKDDRNWVIPTKTPEDLHEKIAKLLFMFSGRSLEIGQWYGIKPKDPGSRFEAGFYRIRDVAKSGRYFAVEDIGGWRFTDKFDFTGPIHVGDLVLGAIADGGRSLGELKEKEASRLHKVAFNDAKHIVSSWPEWKRNIGHLLDTPAGETVMPTNTMFGNEKRIGDQVQHPEVGNWYHIKIKPHAAKCIPATKAILPEQDFKVVDAGRDSGGLWFRVKGYEWAKLRSDYFTFIVVNPPEPGIKLPDPPSEGSRYHIKPSFSSSSVTLKEGDYLITNVNVKEKTFEVDQGTIHRTTYYTFLPIIPIPPAKVYEGLWYHIRSKDGQGILDEGNYKISKVEKGGSFSAYLVMLWHCF